MAHANPAETPSPAVDFYAWANREWLKETTIRADRSREDNFGVLEDDIYEQIRSLFAELKATASRTPEQDKLLMLYDGFVDMNRRDAQGIASIAGELKSIDEIKTHRDIARWFAYAWSIGVAAPVLMEPHVDYKDSTTNIGLVSQAGLGIEREYYLGTDKNSRKQKRLYRNHLSALFKLISTRAFAATAGRVVELETQLAKIQWSAVENRNKQKTYNPTTVKAFISQSAPFYGDEMVKAWRVPSLDAKVSVMQPSYIEQFGALFRSTSVSAWQEYLRARVLVAYAGLLTSAFRSANVQYEKDRGLIQEETEMWRQGIDFVSQAANMMLGRAYVERYFDEDTKAGVTRIVMAIHESFRSSIAQVAWMSDETRRKALDKMDKMKFKIGYPDRWPEYDALEIRGTDLVEDYMRAARFEHDRSLAKFGQPVDRNDWGHSPHEINAYYDPTRNEFVLLAAILREPFYSTKGSMAMQYGGLGFVVGHEMGHGFDDQGSQFDGEGNLVNWWTDEDAKAYNDKKQRLIDQANHYEILPGTFLRGENEIGEIMGDLSGAQIALRAYKKTAGASDEAFFIQLAQTWRSKQREQFLRLVIQEDVHPPSEFRANGIVKQFDEFHAAFNIKPDDRMYLAPEERVLLW
jgi:predicted metalloendopeptidase